jgi:hypothetical protein
MSGTDFPDRIWKFLASTEYRAVHPTKSVNIDFAQRKYKTDILDILSLFLTIRSLRTFSAAVILCLRLIVPSGQRSLSSWDMLLSEEYMPAPGANILGCRD